MTRFQRRRLLALMICAVGFIACGDSTVSNTPADAASGRPSARICDGSDALRFVYTRGPGESPVEHGSQIVFRHGKPFLFVRGDCRYWVWSSETFDPNQEAREGTLSAQQEAALAEEMKYDQWSVLEGVYDLMSRPDDAGPDILSDSVHRVVCFAKCSFGEPPAEVRQLHEAIGGWVSRLHDQGTALGGPVRVAAVDISLEFPVWSYGAFDWTLSFPLAGVTIPGPTGAPLEGDIGFVIEKAADVELLRDARRRQLNEEFHPAFAGGFIWVQIPDYLKLSDHAALFTASWACVGVGVAAS